MKHLADQKASGPLESTSEDPAERALLQYFNHFLVFIACKTVEIIQEKFDEQMHRLICTGRSVGDSQSVFSNCGNAFQRWKTSPERCSLPISPPKQTCPLAHLELHSFIFLPILCMLHDWGLNHATLFAGGPWRATRLSSTPQRSTPTCTT